jgi:hypothetical protein
MALFLLVLLVPRPLPPPLPHHLLPTIPHTVRELAGRPRRSLVVPRHRKSVRGAILLPSALHIDNDVWQLTAFCRWSVFAPVSGGPFLATLLRRVVCVGR